MLVWTLVHLTRVAIILYKQWGGNWGPIKGIAAHRVDPRKLGAPTVANSLCLVNNYSTTRIKI